MGANNKVQKALLPLSWIYGAGVWLRNKLFDWGIIPVEEFSIPVICIGNLSVGGTGKTPHTEYLIRLLSSQYRIAVLSRGYKRKTSGFILADEHANSQTIGDEPFQMFRKFPQVLVAVDSERKRGISQLLTSPENQRPEVILLDDAYQHRYVKPSLSILLTDSNRLFCDDALLPAGRLREPAKNKSRADIVLVTKCSEILTPADFNVISQRLALQTRQNLFFTSYEYGLPTPVFPKSARSIPLNLSDLRENDTAVLLVAGIASPQGLIDELKKYTPRLSTLIYSDHHDFTSADLREISTSFHRLSAEKKFIVTTEKDAVRLMGFTDWEESIQESIYYLPIQVIFKLNQEEIFIQKIEDHVKDIARNRILA